jgi:hypothetical protein
MVAEAWLKPHAVDWCFVLANRDAVQRRVDQLVPLAEVVFHGRLIEDVGDYTVHRRAERVVLLFVGKATSREQTDVRRLAVAGNGVAGGGGQSHGNTTTREYAHLPVPPVILWLGSSVGRLWWSSAAFHVGLWSAPIQD